MIYLFLLFLQLFLSFHYDIKRNSKRRDFCLYFLLISFILLAGLRWRLCVDTPEYIYRFYHVYPTVQELSWEDLSFGKDPFFVIINSFVKTFGGRFFVVQLIHASFVNILVFNYIKRHSSYLFTSLLFYYLFCYFGYSMEIMRASMAIVISLYANDFFIEKKWIKGYLLLFMGCMFHAQTILLLIQPLFLFLRFNKIGIVTLIGAFFLGIIAQRLLIDYMFLFYADDVVSGKMSNYLEDETYGTQSGNINFYIVNILPNLIYCVLSLLYLKWKNAESNVLRLEPFLMLGGVFLVMQMGLQIAYRYVDFYRIYFVLFTSEAFVAWLINSSKLEKKLAYVRTLVAFLPLIVLNNFYTIRNIQILYPYSSVIERTIDEQREKSYMAGDRPKANRNEY